MKPQSTIKQDKPQTKVNIKQSPLKSFLRKLRHYPLSCLCLTLVLVLSFCTMPKTPLDEVALIDKWTHIAMYGGTYAIIWFEHMKRYGLGRGWRIYASVEAAQAVRRHLRRLLLVWLSLVLLGGVIELLQEYCTDGRRSGDWIDFIANTLGATLWGAIGLLWARCRTKE